MSECKIIKSESKSILTFCGTTEVGSSGGLIINHQGKIVGISTGYYCDKEEQGNINSNNHEEEYDLLVENENKENYEKNKNTNLGLKINHPFLLYYFAQMGLNSENIQTNKKEKNNEDYIEPSNEKFIKKRKPDYSIEYLFGEYHPKSEESKKSGLKI